jgi:NAD-dependent deacetylase
MPNIVILTGAGISAESGIPTFRDSMGLWEKHKVEDVATPQGFQRDPALVHRFYNERRAKLITVEPNAAHYALAKLEQAWPSNNGFVIITQNIDDLHERAGSKSIAHMHGELLKLKCANCKEKLVHHGDASVDMVCPSCRTTGSMRPDVVWFGELPYHLGLIEPALDHTDIFISIGTSGQVMPASLFAQAVSMNRRNAQIIEVNPIPTENEVFTRVIDATATTGVPALVDELIAAYCGQTEN